MDWQDISSAPRDEYILLYGFLRPHPDDMDLYCNLENPRRVVGYWDTVDEAWCPVGSTFEGPWFTPTHWQPLPPPPEPTEAGR